MSPTRDGMTPQQFKAWRKRLGLTQARAADAIGMSATQIKNYEAGRATIPLYVELACAALALGITEYPSAAA